MTDPPATTTNTPCRSLCTCLIEVYKDRLSATLIHNGIVCYMWHHLRARIDTVCPQVLSRVASLSGATCYRLPAFVGHACREARWRKSMPRHRCRVCVARSNVSKGRARLFAHRVLCFAGSGATLVGLTSCRRCCASSGGSRGPTGQLCRAEHYRSRARGLAMPVRQKWGPRDCAPRARHSRIDSCCFHYLIRSVLVAFLQALFNQTRTCAYLRSQCAVILFSKNI